MHFVQRYREPARGTKPTFVAPPVSPWRLKDYEQHCEWAEAQSTKLKVQIAFGRLQDWCLHARAQQAVLAHDAKEEGDAQGLADATSMEWRYVCGPSTTNVFCPHRDEKFISEFLAWRSTRADPIPRWRFTTQSFMYLDEECKVPPTFRDLHLDPDKWLTPMVQFMPTASNPESNDEWEMFLRLRYLANANDRAHAMRCVDTLRIFVRCEILGSLKIGGERELEFEHKPVAPSVLESLGDIWPKVFGYLYQNRGEWTRTPTTGDPMLDPAPRESKHTHFRWSAADVRLQTRNAIRSGICDARNTAVRLFQDPFMRTANPTPRQVSNFLRAHGFRKRRKLPPPVFDQPDYRNY